MLTVCTCQHSVWHQAWLPLRFAVAVCTPPNRKGRKHGTAISCCKDVRRSVVFGKTLLSTVTMHDLEGSAGAGKVMFCSDIVNAVLNAFRRLPKTGKPQGNEHTVLAGDSRSRHLCLTLNIRYTWYAALLAGFVLTGHSGHRGNCQVVALGTGTKCLSGLKRTSQVIHVLRSCKSAKKATAYMKSGSLC